MRIFLDDDHPDLNPSAVDRVKWFEEFSSKFNDEDVVWVTTAIDCIELLEKGNVDAISLDHDLGFAGCSIGCSHFLSFAENMKILENEAESGLDVAKWIYFAVLSGVIPTLKWEVHSQNPIGKESIKSYLNNITH